MLQNRLFLPQNQRKKKAQPQNSVSQYKQFKVIHQLDCIYQGQINQSHHKEGFGQQQNNNFETYIGFWRSSKAHGTGMVIYPDRGVIYGNFKDNQVCGEALVDDGCNLKLGIFNHERHIEGIGFEYSSFTHVWKMSRYHKNLPIDVLSTTTQPISEGIPPMLNLHEDLFMLLQRYLKQEFFDMGGNGSRSRLQNSTVFSVLKPFTSYTEMNYHKISSHTRFIGQMIEDKFWGIGCIFDWSTKKVLEAGYYEKGQLHGYGLRIYADRNAIEIGRYNRGKKEGFFYERINKIELIKEYCYDFCKGDKPNLSKKNISNDQKIYNYRKNDFYSQKNHISFGEYVNLFRDEKKLKDEIRRDQEGATQNVLTKLKSKKLQNKTMKVKSSQTINVQKDVGTPSSRQKSPRNNEPSTKYMAQTTAMFQKTTVDLVRQKFSHFESILKKSKNELQQSKHQEKQKKQGNHKKTDELNPSILRNNLNSAFDQKEESDMDGEVLSEDRPVERFGLPLNQNQRTRIKTMAEGYSPHRKDLSKSRHRQAIWESPPKAVDSYQKAQTKVSWDSSLDPNEKDTNEQSKRKRAANEQSYKKSDRSGLSSSRKRNKIFQN